mgnify:FL=1
MRTFKNLFTILFSISFTIILCELFLRYDDSYIFPAQYSYELSDRVYSFTNKIDFNNFSDKNRLLIMGDSFTAGFKNASNKKDFPAQLIELIPNYEGSVINMGIGGKSIIHYIDWSNHLKLSSSDTIIIVLYENDIMLDKENCNLIKEYEIITNIDVPSICHEIISGKIEPTHKKTNLKKINNYINDYYIIKLVKNVLYQFEYFQNKYTRSEVQNLWSDFNSEENIFVRESLYYLKEYVKSHNSNIIFTYFPNTHQIKKNKKRNRKTWSEFIKYMKKNDVVILDPYEFFFNNSINDRMVFSLSDSHPNSEANFLMAKFLSKYF